MLAPAASAAGLFALASENQMIASDAAHSRLITPSRTYPCLGLPTSLPNARVRLTGITRIRNSSIRFVQALGFSNGCAELALRMPPPLVPSSLIASWLAAGARAMVLWLPSGLVTATPALRLCTTPSATSTIANTNAIGSSTRTVPRVRSTQKLPSRSVFARTNPRVTAIATARPTPADRKFCTVSPAICTKWPIVVSGT